MSISKSANKYNRQSWENSEFPILCETCLGDNPYVRMVKDKFGGECNVCERPYTSFKWCPGKRMRHKTTVICQICAKLKNICQTCLFDLEYGLPVEVRDKVLDIKDDLPQSDANREYYRQIVEKNVVDKDETALVGGMVGKARKDNQLLQRLARNAPYYNRNRPHICSFWVKGQCNRGDACPYRHEMPSEFDSNFSQKAVRDRYYGVNDPLANKIMQNVNALPKLEPPKNRAITTLCVAGINVYVNETDIYNHFYQYGPIKRVYIPDKKEVAFVTFNDRKDAELAADTAFNKLTINNQKLRVMWAKTAQPNKNGDWNVNDVGGDDTTAKIQSDPHFPHPKTITNPESVVVAVETDSKNKTTYPSQNPGQLGSKK